MASLMVDFIISLDGYASADGWPGYWGMEGPEYLAWIGEEAENEHVALMGATTYRLMSGFAAELPDEPGLAALTALPKVVFSSTLEAPLSWAKTELVDGDAVETVKDMKQRDQRPLRTIGSLSLCRSLLRAGVVDRFRVVVFPVITRATGKERIFDGYPDVTLDLVESRTFDARLQLLEYVSHRARCSARRGRLAGVIQARIRTRQSVGTGSRADAVRAAPTLAAVTQAIATSCSGVSHSRRRRAATSAAIAGSRLIKTPNTLGGRVRRAVISRL
jgi:dihydrofolate reductase